MLSEVRVRRLARRAERRRRDGRRGRRARRAWERLVREGDSGNPHASEAVWQRWAWTGPPDDERWELLARWLGPRAVGRVMEAAADPGLDAARRSRLASFCTRHGLAPEDPAERVRFFLLTGQQEQRRALDPDGALLAAAYQTAGPPQRAALRVALAGVGDLDVTRMIAASGAMRLADMTTAEREYLADRLADRGDWAGLWRLARDLPLYDAVAAVRRIGGRWRPDGQHDRELFGFLAGADPQAVRRARDALDQAAVIRVEVPGKALAAALSAGGRRLGVLTDDGTRPPPRSEWPRPRAFTEYDFDNPPPPVWPRPATISVHELPSGALADRYRTEVLDFADLVFAGSGLMAVQSRIRLRWDSTVDRYPEGAPREVVFRGGYHIAASAAWRRGFVTVSPDNWRCLLRFHDESGGLQQSLWVPALPGPKYPVGAPPVSVAVVRGGSHVAVAHDRRAVVLGARRGNPGARLIAQLSLDSEATGVCFAGGGLLIVADRKRVALWRLDARLPCQDQAPHAVPGAHDLVWIKERDEICFLDRSGRVGYLDARTLTPVRRGRELSGQRGDGAGRLGVQRLACARRRRFGPGGHRRPPGGAAGG